MNSFLQDKDIKLRAPELEDLEAMYRLENTTDLWQYANVTGPYSRYALKRFIEQSQNDLFSDLQLRLMIEIAAKEVVGIIDLFNYDSFNRRAEIGIIVEATRRRQGIGRTALTLLTDYAFRRLAVHQLYAYIDRTNTACLSLFVSCGYRECACLKDWMRAHEGGFRDASMLRLISSLP